MENSPHVGHSGQRQSPLGSRPHTSHGRSGGSMSFMETPGGNDHPNLLFIASLLPKPAHRLRTDEQVVT